MVGKIIKGSPGTEVDAMFVPKPMRGSKEEIFSISPVWMFTFPRARGEFPI